MHQLIEITQFADFETPQMEHVVASSENKQELIDLCKRNNWPCTIYNPTGYGWENYYIRQG